MVITSGKNSSHISQLPREKTLSKKICTAQIITLREGTIIGNSVMYITDYI